MLGSYLASLSQMSAKCYMRSTKEINRDSGDRGDRGDREGPQGAQGAQGAQGPRSPVPVSLKLAGIHTPF